MKRKISNARAPWVCFVNKNIGLCRPATPVERTKNIYAGIMVVSILLFFAGCGSNKVQSGQVSPPNNQVAETADSVLHNHHETSSGDTATTEVLSPPREASATIGNSEFRVKYSAPSVRDRVIWGGLVGYDRVWVSGAHMATSIQFNEDIYFNDNLVPAGKYAFFTIPGRDSWTVILNDNWNQHLADDYDPDLDVLRLNVVPEPHEFTEQLRYSVSGSPAGTGIMELAWEELKISIELRGPSI